MLDQLERHRQLVGVLGLDGPLTASVASADGSLLAAAETVMAHSQVVLWDGGRLAELRRLDMGNVRDTVQSRTVRALTIDPTGVRLAVGFDDSTVSVWDIRAAALIQSHLAGHDPRFKLTACQIAHRNLTPTDWQGLQMDAPFWTVACPEWPK